MLCVDAGDKLKLARKWHQPALTQKKLAEMLKVDTSTVGRWEADNHIPGDKVEAVEAALKIAPGWLLDADDGHTEDMPPPQAEEPSNVRAIHPSDLGKVGHLLENALEARVPIWDPVLGNDEAEQSFLAPTNPRFRKVALAYTMGHPERHVLCVISGMSMAPRIEHADQALVLLDPDVPPGHLVVARSPDQRNFIKKLVKSGGRLELHPLNPSYKPIVDLADWTLKGGVTMIRHSYEPGKPNIEWDDGKFLRA